MAQNLLDFYKEKKDNENFIRIGKYVLKEWGNQFDRYLYENLDKEHNPDFLSDILFHYAEKESSIDLFKEYKKIFGQDTANSFLDRIKANPARKRYYIQLLKEEKDYAAILNFVKNHTNDSDFIEYIKPVISVYPTECFNIIRKKTDQHFENYMGRGSYREAVQWLKLLLNIEEKDLHEKIQRYFNSLFAIYNRRPALKNELKKAGISPT